METDLCNNLFILKTQRNLYGLKQASFCLNKKFEDILKYLNLKQTLSNPCAFVKHGHVKLVLVIYVDKGIIASIKVIEIE